LIFTAQSKQLCANQRLKPILLRQENRRLTHQLTMGRLDGRVGFFQGWADLGFARLFQFFLRVDPRLRLVRRRHDGLLLMRAARKQQTGHDHEKPILDFHHYLFVANCAPGRLSPT
jgi:hypothetical protein